MEKFVDDKTNFIHHAIGFIGYRIEFVDHGFILKLCDDFSDNWISFIEHDFISDNEIRSWNSCYRSWKWFYRSANWFDIFNNILWYLSILSFSLLDMTFKYTYLHCKYFDSTQYSFWQCYVSNCNLVVYSTVQNII